jgi:branched-chain amino acid transport system substrate-binding protein
LNGDPSIAAQVTRITSLPAKPDLVFLCSYAPGGPSAMRQLRAAGVEAAILTGESMDGDYWIGSVPNLSISTWSIMAPNMATIRTLT